MPHRFGTDPAAAAWLAVAADFGRFHADPVNVALHLVTTPLGIWGALLIALSVLHAVGIALFGKHPDARVSDDASTAGASEPPSASGHFKLWVLDGTLALFMAGLVFRGGVPTTHAAFTACVLLVLRGWAVKAHMEAASARHALGLGVAATVVGFVMQDVAHAVTGEPTFQQSYHASEAWWATFAQHTLLLLPLCYDAALTALGVAR